MHRGHALQAAAAVGAALALSGCIGGVVVDEPVYEQHYVDGELEYAARSGELRTNVYGTPFAAAADRVAAVTTADMKGANRGPEITFTPTPKVNGSEGYHVVMLFSPVRGVTAYDICQAGDGSGHAAAPESGRVRLLSAFCFNDTLVSTAGGTVAGATGLEDPRFRSLVRQVTLSLFPGHDRKDRGDGGDAVP